jgi:hypothetical protein
MALGPIALEISSCNSRVAAALQKRWDRPRAGLELILDQRGADMADLPVGASGLLARDYKGKEADRLVTRIDPGVVLLVAELRGHGRQASEELGQWKTHQEERRVMDASPAAITLATLRNGEGLDSMEKRAGDGEIAGHGRPDGSNVTSPQPAARHGRACPSIPRRWCSPRRRSRVGGVICWRRIRARGKGSFPILQGRRAQGSSPRCVTPANQQMPSSAAITGGMGISQQ